MGYIHTISINNNESYLIEPTLFTTVNNGEETSSLVATIPNFELTPGVSITIKMDTYNPAQATLSINNIAKPIYYQGSAIEPGLLKKNFIYNLVYDGAVWHIVGEKIDNDEITLAHKLTFGAGQTYIYDGSQDVTVPVFMGTIL